jgi:hypothetical protein
MNECKVVVITLHGDTVRAEVEECLATLDGLRLRVVEMAVEYLLREGKRPIESTSA